MISPIRVMNEPFPMLSRNCQSCAIFNKSVIHYRWPSISIFVIPFHFRLVVQFLFFKSFIPCNFGFSSYLNFSLTTFHPKMPTFSVAATTQFISLAWNFLSPLNRLPFSVSPRNVIARRNPFAYLYPHAPLQTGEGEVGSNF